MTTRTGLDYAYGHPRPSVIRAAGHRFVCRYLADTANPKNLTAVERDALLDGGLDVVLVFEQGATRALAGSGTGTRDGATAKARADALGAPPTAAIYAAVDFGPSAVQMPDVLAYLRGFARGCAPHPLGVYGGWATIDAAHRAGLTRYLWQAGAWSTFRDPESGRHAYRLHPASVLRQHAGTVMIDGVACDLDDALAADYGGWTGNPMEDDDMTPAQEAKLDKLLALAEKHAEDDATRYNALVHRTGHGELPDVLDAIKAVGGADPVAIVDEFLRRFPAPPPAPPA